jgi:hypothetical protein
VGIGCGGQVKKFTVIFAILSFSFSSFAKSPHHEGLLSSINLGVRYSSILKKRGVVEYRGFQLDPVLAVFLLDDKIEFLGDSIGYRDFVANDWLRLRTRFVSISDKPLFPVYESAKIVSSNRTDTYEWSNRAEIFLPGYNDDYNSEIDFEVAKDLSTHHGTYLELTGKVKLFEGRLPKFDVKVEPNFFASVGWGDLSHNQYFYGSGAADGFNNLSYGLWIALPEEADRFYPIVQLTRFQVLGNNRNATLAVANNEGWLFSVIATMGLLE